MPFTRQKYKIISERKNDEISKRSRLTLLFPFGGKNYNNSVSARKLFSTRGTAGRTRCVRTALHTQHTYSRFVADDVNKRRGYLQRCCCETLTGSTYYGQCY